MLPLGYWLSDHSNFIVRIVFSISCIYEIVMFPNSSELRLERDVKRIISASKMIKTSIVPVNVQRITNNSFRYCDVKEQHLSTHIIQCSFDKHYHLKQ